MLQTTPHRISAMQVIHQDEAGGLIPHIAGLICELWDGVSYCRLKGGTQWLGAHHCNLLPHFERWHWCDGGQWLLAKREVCGAHRSQGWDWPDAVMPTCSTAPSTPLHELHNHFALKPPLTILHCWISFVNCIHTDNFELCDSPFDL